MTRGAIETALRAGGRLVMTIGETGVSWTIEPHGEPIDPVIAAKLIASLDLPAGRDGLFDGAPSQTWGGYGFPLMTGG